MKAMEDFAAQRDEMVRKHIERRGIAAPRVLKAMRTVPRHLFVPEIQRKWAYADRALHIGLEQTISQPYIVALMTELMQLQGDETVLEVGTGSGYQAAVLAELVGQVHTIERHAALAERARQTLADLQITNVSVHLGDGTLGLPEFSPYQVIIVTAAAPKTPRALLEQLDEGGRLVIPVGSRYRQVLEVWQRAGTKLTHKAVTAVAFVPLLGEDGWAGVE